MKLIYLFKESLRGFSRAKLSTFASILTITLSLILIAIYYTISVKSNNLINSVKEKVEVEAFLQDNIEQTTIDSLRDAIKRIGGIKSVNYISKEEAARIFSEEFGSEMLDILESNPLPPSFKIDTYDEYKTIERIDKIKSQIEGMYGVIEVYYPQKNLGAIEETSSGILYLNLTVLIIITLSSIFLVSNTIRLVIQSKRRVIQTLKLLGATKNFIRTPFLFEGLIQGLMAGILAVLVIIALTEYYTAQQNIDTIGSEIYNFVNFLYIIIIGVLLGAVGSIISIRRHLNQNIKI